MVVIVVRNQKLTGPSSTQNGGERGILRCGREESCSRVSNMTESLYSMNKKMETSS